MRYVFVILILGMGMSSCDVMGPCSSKDKMLVSLNEIVEEVEKSDIRDWTTYDQRFDQVIETCYPKLKEKMSIEEKLEYYKDVVVYSVERDDRNYDLEKIIVRSGATLEEELEVLGDQGQEELKRYIKENVAPELEKMIDDVIKGLEDFGDELKQALDELAN